MFGTVATMVAKPGQERKLVENFERWWNERRPKVRGAVSSTVYKSADDPNGFFAAIVFDSKESYEANANDPEQDRWYRELVQLLEAEPTWYDGEVLAHMHV